MIGLGMIKQAGIPPYKTRCSVGYSRKFQRKQLWIDFKEPNFFICKLCSSNSISCYLKETHSRGLYYY